MIIHDITRLIAAVAIGVARRGRFTKTFPFSMWFIDESGRIQYNRNV